MNEKTKQEIAKEKAEKRAIEFENKLLRFLLPIVGGIAFIFGLTGLILTANSGQAGVVVFYVILLILGLTGGLYGGLLIMRKKNPNFLKFNKVEEEDTVLTD